MNRCPNEYALVRIYTHEGTAAEQSHLRFCADCAERYDLLVEDLATIGQALDAPPAAELRERAPWRMRWVPAAAACVALLAVAFGLARLREPSRMQVASRTASSSAFAADLSAALFASSEVDALPQLAAETPYLEAALDAGRPCTQDGFLSGECSDQLSALLSEGE